ncbi:MAG: SusC/RagA family TonB-linked outer membrane protein [Flavobacteriaceae bacterium]|nr:SusC/RagA family TonB-linked outer membrane protein [Flavobacteriaceae bacterium]
MFILFASNLVAQEKIISGVVNDSYGNPIPGVNILQETQKTNGTVTDFDGNFTISVSGESMLIFSYVGFITKKVETNDSNLEVILEEDLLGLDEVTVVAYGTQKKASVIAAVTSINPEELRVPTSNLTSSIAGRVAGVISYQRSGEPGRDNAEFFIRGVSTFGYARSPLILIDGIETTSTDLARLQPDDIASFSIMKDATATALYGARGANGVILVTTKEGKEGVVKINVRYEKAYSAPTKSLEIADPVTYMTLHNEALATRNPLGGRIYSLEKILISQDPNRNIMAYPTVNWFDELLEDYTLNSRFNFNVSGGGKVARYYLAATVNSDNGNLKIDPQNNFNNNINFKRISLRSNVNVNLTSTTEVALKFNGNFDDYIGPLDGGAAIYQKAMQTNPVLYPRFYEPDLQFQNSTHILFGNYGQFGDYLNPYADMIRGYKDESYNNFLATVEVKQDLGFIAEGLNARILGNTSRYSFYNLERKYNPFYYTLGNYDFQSDQYTLIALNPNQGTEYLEYNEGNKVITNATYFEASLNYNTTIDDIHEISGMIIGISRELKYANAGDLQRSLPYRNLGVSGRFTYAYDERYFSEFNFGYNGSERFAKSERFGFFPSFGFGWYMSNEDFMSSTSDVITKLKLKSTYGLVGNDQIGSAEDRFFYISQVNLNDGSMGAPFGNEFSNYINGVSIDRYANDQITWEKAKMLNVGFELGLFGKVDIQADYFTEYRSNILMDRAQVPASMGLQSPIRANVGEASSKGFEMSLDYKDNITNDFFVAVRANFSFATSKYEVFEELDYVSAGLPWRSRIGLNLSQPFGYIAERLFIDEADIANSPIQTFGDYMAGDIKYKDINNDGIIDINDEVPIGYPTTPEIIYGFGTSASYRNFDFSFFFQGSARSSFFVDAYNTSPFIDTSGSAIGNNALLSAWANDHWSENDRNLYASWPRLSDQLIDNNNRNSTWWLRDGAFLRLKSIEFGYSFTDKLTEKLGFSAGRVYVSGTNLLTFSKFKLWDIEMGGNGLGYPIQKGANLGLNINF